MLELVFGGFKIYAIIETGSKQYQVSPGQVIDVELLEVEEGKQVEMERVLLIADGDKITVGTPLVAGAKVVATAQSNGKGDKIIVLKYKPKVRYTKKTGHRQLYTRLAIDKIVAPGMEEPKEAKPARKRAPRTTKKEVSEDGA
ncbi:50S ribosomal protein L21 [Chloroflexota bacterium]